MLESAMSRPEQKWYYGQYSSPPDLFDLAAAYAYGIISNHAFHDGNKRTGSAACLLFLRIDGIELKVLPAKLITVFVGVARGRVSEHDLDCWLRRRRR